MKNGLFKKIEKIREKNRKNNNEISDNTKQ